MRPHQFLTFAAFGVAFVLGEEDLTQYVNPFIGTTGGGNGGFQVDMNVGMG